MHRSVDLKCLVCHCKRLELSSLPRAPHEADPGACDLSRSGCDLSDALLLTQAHVVKHARTPMESNGYGCPYGAQYGAHMLSTSIYYLDLKGPKVIKSPLVPQTAYCWVL